MYQKSRKWLSADIRHIPMLSDIDALQSGCTVLVDLRRADLTRENWPWFQKVLISQGLTCIWFCSGATLECSEPWYAKFAGLIRVARDEYSSKHTVVEIDADRLSDLGSLDLQNVIQGTEEDFHSETRCLSFTSTGSNYIG